MKKGLVLGLISILFVVLCGCNNSKDLLEQALKKTVEENLTYSQQENLEKYMDTLYLSDKEAEFTRQQTKELFDNTDLDYKFESFKVKEFNKTTAKVEVVQITKAKKINKGFQFRDNKTTSIHTLKRHDNKWKLSSTELVKVEYLDQSQS
jgi:hypothetical protein